MTTKSQHKQTTLNYLTTNNIPHHIHNNTIISFPQTSPQFENLACPHTQIIHQDNNQTPIILIHNY